MHETVAFLYLYVAFSSNFLEEVIVNELVIAKSHTLANMNTSLILILKYNISVAGFAVVPQFLDGDVSHP